MGAVTTAAPLPVQTWLMKKTMKELQALAPLPGAPDVDGENLDIGDQGDPLFLFGQGAKTLGDF
jgi:hypothetical protein